MARIQLKNVVKKWGNVEALKKTNIDIKDKEFLVLLGPSGCGKTTTMRMIAGLEDPTEGEIMIEEKVVNHLEPKERNISMVFQSYALYPHLTVYENICFPMKVRKSVPKNEWKERVLKAAKMVELKPLLDRYPKELSGGQRQRVALARAIVREKPSCFLMDEPLSNLDAKLRLTMRTEIKRLQETLQITTIYVTHDQIEAMTLAHRVVLLQNGKIEQIATPTEIYNDPATLFVAGFIGNPAMSLISGEIEKGIFYRDGIQVQFPKNISQKDVTLGVRSEDLKIVSEENAEIKGTVYVFERLGECNMITLAFKQERLTAKISKDKIFKTGETIFLKGLKEKYYLFDNQTKHRIRF